MLKNISKLEYVIGNRVYQLLCDSDSPLNEVKDAIFQFLKYVGQIEDAVKAAQEEKNKEAAEEPKEESKIEEIVG